ncbi:MAG: DNA-processing protein DprA [Opitutales bacterium]
MMAEEPPDRRQAYQVLNALPLMGPITLNRLLETFGSPEAVLGAGKQALMRVPDVGPAVAESIVAWRDQVPLEREQARMAQRGIRFITVEDAVYPKPLREIHDPPIGLYALGHDEPLSQPAVAIVGSRKCTYYGLETARKLAAGLARRGYCIVSGLARGIDGAAHEGALEAGGTTVAVLGNGIDIIYPPEHLELYRTISTGGRGLILSEFPLGKKAHRQTFPMRNRVVAGMTLATIVVETDLRGGALITARFAMEQGRLVGAIPGRIDQAPAAGCLQLIRDGALCVTSVDDIIEELRATAPIAQMGLPLAAEPEPEATGGAAPLSEDEQRIVDTLAGGECLPLDTLCDRLDLPAPKVSTLLMALELKGRVAKHADGRFEAAG